MNNEQIFNSQSNGGSVNSTDKKDEIAAIVALVLAIVSFLLLIWNDEVAMGGLGYILIFVGGARGLKSSKRNLAIAAMALGAISLVIFIVKLLIRIVKLS